MELAPHRDHRRHLTRTDLDPRVRHRADGVRLVASGLSLTQAAQTFGCCRTSLRSGRTRFLLDGRDGLADRGRCGRPPKVDAAARTLLAQALGRSPLDAGYPVTTWTGVDLPDMLSRHGSGVCPATVHRTRHAMG